MTPVTLDWLHIVALLGAVQGVFLACVLATRKENSTANRVLAAAVFAFTVFLLTSVYHAVGLVSVFPHFFGIAYPLPLLFGPLVYLYAITASDRTRRLTRRDAVHFLPFVLAVLGGLPVYLMSGAAKIAFYERLLRGERTALMQIVDPIKLLSGVTYTVLTLLFLLRHRERVKNSYSFLERVNLQWLLWLGASAAFIWVLAVAFQLMESTNMPWARSDDVIALAIAILVYGIGYMGLRQPEVFRYEKADSALPTSAEPSQEPRYERSGLSEREAAALQESLLATMETKRPWQDSELTLANLAELLSTTPHKISEVLNARVGQTFYDFVNGYRVREVQRRMTDGGRAPTLLALALDAGFASKSTFNDVFKKHTGQTPSAYRRVKSEGVVSRE